MTDRLADKAAIVTGGASGIGQATVARFIAEGARVLVADRAEDGARQVVADLGVPEDRAIAMGCDITDVAAVTAMVGRATDAFGKLDILVNSAGISGRHIPEGATAQEAWRMLLDVNVTGSMLVSHAAVPEMLKSGGGSIVNLASVMGMVVHTPDKGLSDGFNPYAPSKGAVIQMTKDLAVTFGKQGVRCNAVCPGYIETPLTASIRNNPNLLPHLVELHPMNRLGKPEEIANVIAFLASDEASFVTGAAWMVDGGYTAI